MDLQSTLQIADPLPTATSFFLPAVYRNGPKGSAHVVRAVRIDLRQSLSGIDHAPLLGPYPAAQREIKGDATVLLP